MEPVNKPAASSGGGGGGFRHFFLRGLGIVLPTVLTIWILSLVYSFVAANIAQPINTGLRWTVTQFGWPPPTPSDFVRAIETLDGEQRAEWALLEQQFQARYGEAWTPALRQDLQREWALPYARRAALARMWNSIKIGDWAVLDLLGLIIAVIGIYFLGRVLGGFIGGQLVRRGEQLINRVPLIRNVYPAVKQVTDFLVGGVGPGGEAKKSFNRVIAVQYPRMGIWTIGLVTGGTMQNIEQARGKPSITVFIPSSPTPFTGYVITVAKEDTIDLPITIEDAIKFVVSLGVVIPINQEIADQPPEPRQLAEAIRQQAGA